MTRHTCTGCAARVESPVSPLVGDLRLFSALLLVTGGQHGGVPLTATRTAVCSRRIGRMTGWTMTSLHLGDGTVNGGRISYFICEEFPSGNEADLSGAGASARSSRNRVQS